MNIETSRAKYIGKHQEQNSGLDVFLAEHDGRYYCIFAFINEYGIKLSSVFKYCLDEDAQKIEWSQIQSHGDFGIFNYRKRDFVEYDNAVRDILLKLVSHTEYAEKNQAAYRAAYERIKMFLRGNRFSDAKIIADAFGINVDHFHQMARESILGEHFQ
jgi:hypothetical protein